MEKKTKEELIVEVALLKRNNEVHERRDLDARTEFAKAFHWYKKRGPYDNLNDSEPRVPTWVEVFVELGKILAGRDFRNIEGNVSELEITVKDLERKLGNVDELIGKP